MEQRKVKKSRATPYRKKSKFEKECRKQDEIMAGIFRTLRKNAQDAIDAQEQREEEKPAEFLPELPELPENMPELFPFFPEFGFLDDSIK